MVSDVHSYHSSRPLPQQHCEEQDSTLVFASQGHMRTLYPGLLSLFYWALGDQPCPGFSHMPTDTCLRDLETGYHTLPEALPKPPKVDSSPVSLS